MDNTTIKCTVNVLNGVEYPVIDLDREEETGTPLLYQELQKRMFKIRLNIEKCGGFEKLLVMGGTPTKNYLDKTRDMLKVFLLVYQLEYMLTTEADIAEAVAIARGYDVEPFIRSASWGELVKEADCLREAFVDRWFERAQKRAQVALPLAG